MMALWTKIPIFLDVSPCSIVGKYNISDESTASILHREKYTSTIKKKNMWHHITADWNLNIFETEIS
jgi:hypothetical protein